MRIGLHLSTIFAIFAAPLLSAPPRYTITDLGGAVPYAINRLGDVAGDSDFHAFLWSRGSMTTPPALSTGFSTARGLNDLRQAVGGHVNSSGSSVAFIFDDGVVTDLELPAGTTDTLAAAINDPRQILVNTLSGASAWILSRDGPQEIPSLGGGAVSGNALNQRGEVVGDSIPAGANLTHAFLWSGGKLTDLGVLAGGEAGSYSSATAINDAGQVAGQSSAAGQTQHAFVWADGVMTDLGTLPGDNQSYATAINNRGQIVGWSASARGAIVNATRAVIWDHGTVYNLNSLLLLGSGWSLDLAAAINDHGQIACIGHQNGTAHAILLTPVQRTSLETGRPGSPIPIRPEPRRTWKP